MARILLILTIFGVVLGGCTRDEIGSPQDAGLVSWTELDEQLFAAVPEVIPADAHPGEYAFTVAAARRIRDRGSFDLWMEMCQQAAHPMVAITGYLCISERQPEHRLEGALAVLAAANPEASLAFYSPAFEYLAKQLDATPPALADFTRFMEKTSADEERLALIAAIVPESFLSAWASSEDIAGTPAIVQSIAIDTAFVQAASTGQPTSARIQKQLERFADFDDIRRAIFVRHAPPDTDIALLEDAVRAVLEDDELDRATYRMVVRDRVQFIRERIDIGSLNLSPARRELLERTLAAEAN